MNTPNLTERQKRKIKLKEEKAHLAILDVLAHKGIVRTLQGYQNKVHTIIQLVLDGALIFEREGFEFNEKTVQEIRDELFEVITQDNLEVEENGEDIPFEYIDH